MTDRDDRILAVVITVIVYAGGFLGAFALGAMAFTFIV
jgi:hypothetical protein